MGELQTGSPLLIEFEQYLIENHKSHNTVASYLRDLRILEAWLQPQGQCLNNLSTEVLQGYASEMESCGKSCATISRRMASVRCMCRWMCETGRIGANPADVIETQRGEKCTHQSLSAEEVIRLLKAPDLQTQKGCRDAVMLWMLYTTGMQVAELLELNLENVQMSKGKIVCGKGTKVRAVSLHPMVMQQLRIYVKTIRPNLVTKQERALFVNLQGSPMTRQGFWKLVKAYGERESLTANLSLRELRRSFSEQYPVIGMDPLTQGRIGQRQTRAYSRYISNGAPVRGR